MSQQEQEEEEDVVTNMKHGTIPWDWDGPAGEQLNGFPGNDVPY